MLSRRDFLLASGAAALAASVPAHARRTAPFQSYHDWKPTRVKHVLVAEGVSGNMVLILGAGGAPAVLIDTQAAPFGAQVRREAEHAGSGGTLKLVISTHHHPEITGGLHAFTTDTRVIGHARQRERTPGQMNRYISQVKEFLFREENPAKKDALAAIRADWHDLHGRVASLKAAQFAPTESLSPGNRELTIDGRRLVLIDVPALVPALKGAHTDNDIAVHLPEDDIIIAGGLLTPQMHPVIDHDGGANTTGWRTALDHLDTLATGRTIVIPGEGKVGGKVGGVGGKGSIAWQRQYLTDLHDLVRKQVDAGKTRQDIRRLKPSLGVPASSPGGERLSRSLDAVYDEVISEQNPIKPPARPK